MGGDVGVVDRGRVVGRELGPAGLGEARRRPGALAAEPPAVVAAFGVGAHVRHQVAPLLRDARSPEVIRLDDVRVGVDHFDTVRDLGAGPLSSLLRASGGLGSALMIPDGAGGSEPAHRPVTALRPERAWRPPPSPDVGLWAGVRKAPASGEAGSAKRYFSGKVASADSTSNARSRLDGS